MTLDLAAIVERAEKWRDLTPLAQETFAEGFADDLTADVLALAEEVRRLHEATKRCLGTTRPGSYGPDSVDVTFAEESWATLRDSALSREPAEEAK